MSEYIICIDDNGYYAEEGKAVKVPEMPTVTDARHLFAYRYDEDIQTLILDDKKLTEICQEIEQPQAETSNEERLTKLEKAFTSFSEKFNNLFGN